MPSWSRWWPEQVYELVRLWPSARMILIGRAARYSAEKRVAETRVSAENLKRDSPSGYSGVIGTSSMPLHKRKKGAPAAASLVASRSFPYPFKVRLTPEWVHSANRESPVFREIKGLVTKTVGMHDVVAEALSSLRDEINLAFVYGSVARSREREHSDVDVMVVGNVDFDAIVEKLRDAEKTLNREINPTVYSIREFSKKLRGNFLKTVLADKKLFIIGDEDDLRDLGQKHLA